MNETPAAPVAPDYSKMVFAGGVVLLATFLLWDKLITEAGWVSITSLCVGAAILGQALSILAQGWTLSKLTAIAGATKTP